MAIIIVLSGLFVCASLSKVFLPFAGASLVKKDEFNKAFTSNGFRAPSNEHFTHFSSAKVQLLGKFSSKKEIAMFLANVMHETSGLSVLEEPGNRGAYTWANAGTRMNPNRSYHGRGPLQLSHPQNYNDASIAIFGNADMLIDNPELVLSNNKIGWESAAWYWGAHVGNQSGVKQGKFGSSIQAINGALECKGQSPTTVANRNKYYSNIVRNWNLLDRVDLSGC